MSFPSEVEISIAEAEIVVRMDVEGKRRLHDDALKNAYSNRNIALQYEHETRLKEMDSDHQDRMHSIDEQATAAVNSFSDRLNKVKLEMKSYEKEYDDKISILRTSTDQDLKDLEQKLNSWVAKLKQAQTEELARLTAEVDQEFADAVSCIGIQLQEQLAATKAIHAKGILELRDYYSDLLNHSNEALLDIQTKLEAEKRKNQRLEETRRVLISENKTLSLPLEQLQDTKRRLVTELEKVTRGTLAFTNFKRSICVLEEKLTAIEQSIHLHETEISHVIGDQTP